MNKYLALIIVALFFSCKDTPEEFEPFLGTFDMSYTYDSGRYLNDSLLDNFSSGEMVTQSLEINCRDGFLDLMGLYKTTEPVTYETVVNDSINFYFDENPITEYYGDECRIYGWSYFAANGDSIFTSYIAEHCVNPYDYDEGKERWFVTGRGVKL